jgi:signal transduction histidine kinase
MNSKKELSSRNFGVNILIGVAIALALYNFILFIFNRYMIEYLFYSIYLSTIILWTLFIHGSLAQYFEIYGEKTAFFNSFLILVPLTLTLFIKSIFKSKKNYPFEHKLLNIVSTILILNFAYALIDYHQAIVLFSNLFSLPFALIMWTTISIYKRGNELAIFLLIGNTILALTSVITYMFYEGYIRFNYFTAHSSTIGVITEALLLALMLSYRIKKLHKQEISNIEKINIQKQELIDKSKKAQFGEMLGIIAHQWKQPLSIVGVITSASLFRLSFEQNITQEEHKQAYSEIDEQIRFMGDIVDEFQHFFNPKKEMRLTKLSKPIDLTTELMKKSLLSANIELLKEINLPTQIETLSNELIQVSMNLIKNAIEQFPEEMPNKRISIIGYEDENYSYIQVKDNAGGIEEEIMPKIFEQYFSTKTRERGSGLGLNLCKTIIEKNCKGRLTAHNEESGAVFTIRLDKQRNLSQN